jgi:predicted RNA-binding protein YlxR (DUF448 family)
MTPIHHPDPTPTPVRHAPVRTCVGCKAAGPQRDLRRVVLVGGRVVADPGRRAAGRGAWVHPARECLAGAAKGGFARSFRTGVGRPDIEAIAAAFGGIAGGPARRTDMSTTSGQGGKNAVESVPVPEAMPGATD